MSTDLVPDRHRIDRAALERIIHRAAELQARERDIGEGLTEKELMQLGREVGIPPSLLQQALLEEQTRAVVPAEPGFVTWLSGPAQVAAQRSVPGEAGNLQEALHQCMTDDELLTVKRRYSDQTSWEPRRDIVAGLKRSLDFGARPYELARAKEVVGKVTRIDDGRCHVRLVADLSNTRRMHVRSGAALAGTGAVASVIGVTIGVLVPVALIPAAAAVLIGFGVARQRRARIERAQVALEQILDRLERGEIRVGAQPAATRPSGFARIADEIKKSFR